MQIEKVYYISYKIRMKERLQAQFIVPP